jgi:hypothetical protein|tara:strand:+ start:732 stop:1382 length:651 start_codon:yes stop_codon:yes gene_type:complete
MKIAITGHSSGIGQELDTIISLTTDHTVQGYSKSNGWNIADNDGEDLIQELLEYDPDVFFNNAYYPKIQNRLLERLYDEWKDKSKIIISTGSISGYLKGILLDDNSDYVNDKRELADFCIRNGFNYPYANKTRLHNISFGFVDTPLLGPPSEDRKHLIDSQQAAFALFDLIEEKDFYVAEQVINCKFLDEDSMLKHFNKATRSMLKHIARSNRSKK